MNVNQPGPGDDSHRVDGDAVGRMLEKLSRFIADNLDPDERRALAALLAPGVARAHEPEDEVVGFGSSDWFPNTLPDALSDAIRDRDVRIEGL